jgi:hypothetical protein
LFRVACHCAAIVVAAASLAVFNKIVKKKKILESQPTGLDASFPPCFTIITFQIA